MRRLILLITALLTALIFCACGDKTDDLPEGTVSNSLQSPSALDDERNEQDEIFNLTIGFSLAGEGAFYDQLSLDIKKECDTLNYEAQIDIADSAKKQEQDLENMLSVGVSVIIIDPVDVDLLEPILAECETQNVPVINIMNSINGIVSTLISPDYASIGEKAGQCAVDIYGESGGGCMMLKTDYDSFTMQLMSDGFESAIDKDENISLLSEMFCGNDEEQAYNLTKQELLSEKTINFIFAQNDALASGALRAIDETGKDVSLVVFGAGMDIVESINSGDVYAAIFFGPSDVAENAVYFADKFINDDTYSPPQYKELAVETIKSDNADNYLDTEKAYAQIIGE